MPATALKGDRLKSPSFLFLQSIQALMKLILKDVSGA
jgi:hypothetical protein